MGDKVTTSVSKQQRSRAMGLERSALWFGTLLIACITACAEESALDIVKRSLDLENRNWQRAKDYTYISKEVFNETDGSGRVKSTRVRTRETLIIYGRPYVRLVEKDGKPLSASEARKEEEHLQKEMERRRRESEDQNSKERREYEKQRAETRKFLNEIPEAFQFRITGEEAISGKPAWIVEATPKPAYVARDSRAKMFDRIRGKLWIDKAEYQWVKIDAETTGPISFGWVLARLAPGAAFRFEQTRVNDEVWLPAHAQIAIDGRLALFKKIRTGVDITYANYRKFQTDSRIVSTEAPR
jgi:hypothetical protein